MNIAFRRLPNEASSCCGPTGGATGTLAQVLKDPFFGEVFSALGNQPGAMPLDVTESDNAFVVRADVPGFKKDQIALDLEKGILTVRAEATEEKEENAERYHRRERRSHSVERRIALPEGVLESEIAADLADGVLTITLPKAPQAQARKISIK
ncbi:MAG: Hsp20/alpha crystallin family protein [Phycisphaeraceae bacterium]|nr:Hsp20/alpha crystallin family protein [Phycisphaeraceae bacterium]